MQGRHRAGPQSGTAGVCASDKMGDESPWVLAPGGRSASQWGEAWGNDLGGNSSRLPLWTDVAIAMAIPLGHGSTFLPFQNDESTKKMIQRKIRDKKGEKGKEDGTMSYAYSLLGSLPWLFN